MPKERSLIILEPYHSWFDGFRWTPGDAFRSMVWERLADAPYSSVVASIEADVAQLCLYVGKDIGEEKRGYDWILSIPQQEYAKSGHNRVQCESVYSPHRRKLLFH